MTTFFRFPGIAGQRRSGRPFTTVALTLWAIIPLSVAFAIPADAQEIGSVDFAASKEAVEYKGQKVLLVSQEHAQLLGRFDVSKVDITPETRFVVEVEAAGAPDGKFTLRGIPILAKSDKGDGFVAGINKQGVSSEFMIYTGEFTLPVDPNDIKEGKKALALLLLGLRTKPSGDVWVKSVRLSVGQQETVTLLSGLKASLSEGGFRLEEKGGLLTATSATERKYYSLDLKDQYPSERAFLEASYRGSTYILSEFKAPLFPMGPYIYGKAEELKARAETRGMTLEELLEAHAKDVVAHGGNTIYYANLAVDPETFILAVNAARKQGVFVFAQLGGKMYLKPNLGKEYYETVTKPAAEEVLPKYKGLDGVLGWMGKEEASASEMPLVIEYRRLCKELDPTHNLFTLHNRVESFRADTKGYPEWYGFDRYRFKVAEPGSVLSTPREAVKMLSEEMAACYQEAAKRGRPLIVVAQSWTYLSQKLTPFMERRSGFREITPGVWQGWQRYLPEHAMSLQTWLGLSEGASGSLWYHYYGATNGRGTGMGRLLREECLVDENGKETKYWKELGECFREISKLTPLVLSWHKEARKLGSVDNPWVKASTFIREFDRERYHLLLNTRIAEWDKTSPIRLNNETKLYFDEEGLAGLEKVGDLEFKFTPEGKEPLWDVLTSRKLTINDDGSYTLKLPPGKGIVLLQGTEEDANASAARLKGSK